MVKKLSLCFLFCIVCFSLCACDPSNYYHDYDTLKESVVQVELINYDNPDAKEYNDWFQKIKYPLFDFDKAEVVEVLAEEKLDDFLKTLSEHRILTTWVHMDSPNGLCLRLIHNNDTFEIFNTNPRKSFSAYYDSDGNMIKFVGTGFAKEKLIEFFDALSEEE